MTSYDREDAANGKCSPLQINTETLAEHQARLIAVGYNPLTQREAELARFKPDQIEEYFNAL